jgi:hypothetical protein
MYSSHIVSMIDSLNGHLVGVYFHNDFQVQSSCMVLLWFNGDAIKFNDEVLVVVSHSRLLLDQFVGHLGCFLTSVSRFERSGFHGILIASGACLVEFISIRL